MDDEKRIASLEDRAWRNERLYRVIFIVMGTFIVVLVVILWIVAGHAGKGRRDLSKSLEFHKGQVLFLKNSVQDHEQQTTLFIGKQYDMVQTLTEHVLIVKDEQNRLENKVTRLQGSVNGVDKTVAMLDDSSHDLKDVLDGFDQMLNGLGVITGVSEEKEQVEIPKDNKLQTQKEKKKKIYNPLSWF